MTRVSLRRLLSAPVFIFGVAFALHMVLLFRDARSFDISAFGGTPYGFELGNVASSIAAGRGFSSPLSTVVTGPTAWFTPLYPFLIAAIFKLFGIYSGKSYIAIQFLNCIFASLVVFPIHAIARRSFGGAVATGAAWAWAFLPTALLFPILWLWDTSLAALLFALIFWATLALPESQGLLPWVAYGALWAVGVLVNPAIFSLFPFLLGWLAWRERKQSLEAMKRVAATLVVFIVALIPWVLRNERVLGAPVIFRSNFGLELWLGNNAQAVNTWSPDLHPNHDLAEGRKYQAMGEIAYMKGKEQEALNFMRTHPGDTLRFTGHKFIYTWLGVDSPVFSFSDLYPVSKMAMNIPLSLLMLLGVFFAWRTRHPAAAPFSIVILIFPLVYYVTHPMLRYRFPIDPIMMVLAAYGLGHTVSLVRSRHEQIGKTLAPVSPLSAAPQDSNPV